VLWYLLRRIPLDEVEHSLAAASGAMLVAGLAVQVLLRVVNACRIRLIARAQGAPLSYRGILSVLFTTAFYGLMLPGSIGAGAATLVKYVNRGATFAAAVVSIVVNRAFDVPTTLVAGLFFWGLDRQLAVDPLRHGPLTLLALLSPLGLLLFYAAAFGRFRLLQRIARALNRPALVEGGPMRRGLGNVLEQIHAVGDLPAADTVAVIVVSISKELLGALAVWFFARACGVELSFITIAWMEAATALLVLLPISLSGLGVREGALVLMSARFGIPAPLALTWSLLIFAGIVCVGAIGGLIEARALWFREARAGAPPA
jgi:glycosyltransferase 2 family protein